VKILRYGEEALLVELDDPHLVPALRDAVGGIDGVLEAVPGARTLLVILDPVRLSHERAASALSAIIAKPRPHVATDLVELVVRYDGADLAEVGELVGLTSQAVVQLHSGATYTVRFCGFSPGFAYLDGLDPRLHVPRRAEPRTAVPVGSVAIADEFTGVYPRSSPGGWRLLGRTDATLWDSDRTPPALLGPGTAVRFVPS
jgi:KipI family sensor histidine kinase inhibitor